MSQVINLRLEPLNPPIPGMAKLMIKGWTGERASLQFTIQRNQDHYFLDNAGEWGAGMVSHAVTQLDQEGESHVLIFKANILDPLLKLTSASFRLTLSQSDGKKSAGTIMMPNNLLGSEAAGSTPTSAVVVESAKEPVQSAPVQEPKIPEIIPEPTHVPPPTNMNPPPTVARKSRGLLLSLLGLGLALMIAGSIASYFLFFVSKLGEPETPPAEPPANEMSASVSAACSLEAAKAAANEIDFVKSCIKSSPSTQDLIQVINEAKANNLCTVAQRIYAYKSQSGDKAVALAYAKEFDPASNIPGGCFTSDAETALYWYESVLAGDPENSEAKARAVELKK